MSRVVKLEEVTKKFRDKTVLDQVSLELEQGKRYGFVGLNGAGKTTLMRILAGIQPMNSGRMELFGAVAPKEIERQRKRCGFLIEEPVYFESMTARSNLRALQRLYGKKEEERITEVLRIVGLQDRKGWKGMLRNYSLGMKQRYGIAAAILERPEFLVVDEPTNGLDIEGTEELQEMLLELNQTEGMTLLVSSHLLQELHKLATDYIFIHEGKILEQISAEELLKSCKIEIRVRTKDLERGEMILKEKMSGNIERKGDRLVIRAEDVTGEIVSDLLVKNGQQIILLEEEKIGLEAYFKELIRKG